jgi:glucokinase
MNSGTPQRRVIGIDLGGTKLAAGVIDRDLTVHNSTIRPSHGLTEDAVIELLGEVIEELRAANGEQIPVEAIGLGIPSLIDQRSGSAVMSVNLDIADVPVRGLLADRTGLPVALDNDGNVAALAEQRFGAARGKKTIISLGLGTGISGGIVIDGRLFRGATGSGAELGHVTVDEGGLPCQGNCPNLGCLETMCSGNAIGRHGNDYARANPDSKLGLLLAAGREVSGVTVTELASAGDAGAIEVLATAGRYLGAGLVGLTNTFNPEAVVVGGGAGAAAGEFVLGPARAHLAEHGLRPNNVIAEILPAHFGADAGMLGAAVLAFVDCLDEQLEER